MVREFGSPVSRMAIADRGRIVKLLDRLATEAGQDTCELRRGDDGLYHVYRDGELVEGVQVRRVDGTVELVVNGWLTK